MVQKRAGSAHQRQRNDCRRLTRTEAMPINRGHGTPAAVIRRRVGPPEDLMKTLLRLLAAVAVILAAVPSYGQQTTGTITGRVLDPQDMAVPGVTITATNTATGL